MNPSSVDEITEAMTELVINADLRITLAERGIQRARQFTWEESTRKHLHLFEEVLNANA